MCDGATPLPQQLLAASHVTQLELAACPARPKREPSYQIRRVRADVEAARESGHGWHLDVQGGHLCKRHVARIAMQAVEQNVAVEHLSIPAFRLTP